VSNSLLKSSILSLILDGAAPITPGFGVMGWSGYRRDKRPVSLWVFKPLRRSCEVVRDFGWRSGSPLR
jgi:hypothetical protein